MIARLRRRLAHALDRRTQPLASGIEHVEAGMALLAPAVERVEAALERQDARIAELAERSAAAEVSTAALLHALAADDPATGGGWRRCAPTPATTRPGTIPTRS